jgi:hypothetical protein
MNLGLKEVCSLFGRKAAWKEELLLSAGGDFFFSPWKGGKDFSFFFRPLFPPGSTSPSLYARNIEEQD